jgi:hypothetical protein
VSQTLNLDHPCGEFFTFRDLVECGETWCRLAAEGVRVGNVPVVAQTIEGMHALCREILDPVHRKFGRPLLTYGFASDALTKRIAARISPTRDQHAGSELNASGARICRRAGMSADFCVAGVPTRELARWIVEQRGFDRLYLYGDDRPLHVSVGPDQSRAIVLMVPTADGRRVPKLVRSVP